MTAVILVVEDQPAMQRNIQMSLEMSGYTAVVAANGIKALDALRSQPIDLILADVAMPRMNGYQLAKLRQDPRWVPIPFIFISVRGLDSDVRYGKGLGADDYLVKPFHSKICWRSWLAGSGARTGASSRKPERPCGGGPSHGRNHRCGRSPCPAGREYLTIGALRISAEQHRVEQWRAGGVSLKEFTLLEYLVRRSGMVVSFTELCRATHGLDTTTAEAGNLLYPLIRSLRRRLGYAAGEMGCIESVRGVGYRMAAPAQ